MENYINIIFNIPFIYTKGEHKLMLYFTVYIDEDTGLQGAVSQWLSWNSTSDDVTDVWPNHSTADTTVVVTRQSGICDLMCKCK